MAGFNYRGAWTPTTAYAVDDAYTEAGSTYAVTTAYTSGTAFSSTDTSNSSIIAQAGAQGPAGPAGTVTATGANGNFDVPGLLTNEGGIQFTGNYSNASGTDQIGQKVAVYGSPTFSGPGFCLGPAGEGWTVQHTALLEPHILQRGIGHAVSIAQDKYAIGDTAGIYTYVNAVPGTLAPSDEGVAGANIQVSELRNLLKGAVVTASAQGSTTLSLAANESYFSHPVDGGFLLKLTPKSATFSDIFIGTLNGDSLPLAGTYLNQLPLASASLPRTSAWGVATAAIPDVHTTADSPVLISITVMLKPLADSAGNISYPPFQNGGAVTIAGMNFAEQSKIDHVEGVVGNGDSSTQILHLYVRNPNAQAVIFQGGVAGTYISFDANCNADSAGNCRGVRSSYHAFGSLTGSDLIYGVYRVGSVVNNLLPQPDVEAARSTGASAGFHLFPGAEIVKGPSAAGLLDIALEANNIVWHAGDQVECTAGPFFSGAALSLSWQAESPSTPGQSSIGILTVAKGKNVSAGYQNQRWANGNPFTYYQPFGGALVPPNLNVIDGVWKDWFHSITTPLGSLFSFDSFTDPNQASYSIFNFPPQGSQFNYLKSVNRYFADAFQTSDLLVPGPILAASLRINNDAEFSQGGIIIPDTVTGARMRVQVTNGALVVSVA